MLYHQRGFALAAGNYTANFLALVVVFDSYLTAIDIDNRALHIPTSPVVLTLASKRSLHTKFPGIPRRLGLVRCM